MKIDKPWHRWFRRERRKAARLIHNPAAVVRVAAAVDHKAQHATSARGPLAQVWDDMQTSVRLVRAWGRREYRGVGRGTLVLMVGALLYFVSPIDAIIDAIPVLGFLDDAAVLAWVLGQVRAELYAFRDWEQQARLDAVAPAGPAPLQLGEPDGAR